MWFHVVGALHSHDTGIIPARKYVCRNGHVCQASVENSSIRSVHSYFRHTIGKKR